MAASPQVQLEILSRLTTQIPSPSCVSSFPSQVDLCAFFRISLSVYYAR